MTVGDAFRRFPPFFAVVVFYFAAPMEIAECRFFFNPLIQKRLPELLVPFLPRFREFSLLITLLAAKDSAVWAVAMGKNFSRV